MRTRSFSTEAAAEGEETQGEGASQEQARQLAATLSQLIGEPVELTITENISTLLSYRRSAAMLRYRVHRLFLGAPPEVVQALADYAKGRRGSGPRLQRFVRSAGDSLREARVQRQRNTLLAKGRVHDLGALFDELNQRFFGGKIRAEIGWAREAPSRRRRSIKLGSYLHEARVIRIHPALDRGDVPRFFVSFVIFHEMLHQASPPRIIGDRRVVHTPEFRALERSYPDYERAIAWERENLELLLDPKRLAFDPDDLLA